MGKPQTLGSGVVHAMYLNLTGERVRLHLLMLPSDIVTQLTALWELLAGRESRHVDGGSEVWRGRGWVVVGDSR